MYFYNCTTDFDFLPSPTPLGKNNTGYIVKKTLNLNSENLELSTSHSDLLPWNGRSFNSFIGNITYIDAIHCYFNSKMWMFKWKIFFSLFLKGTLWGRKKD